ncbi:hypothetical protein [Streptomyces xinghaiensis]|uniref:hypothetical protein n=1 Tax=Streptomyces xinghaiensis TaxID=1038928 RepID=UPI002E107358|nr:hypothetical protein OG463_11060 [Streptomyces xinghaiensis]
MEARDPELKKDLNATLHARGELGPEYESELVDSFLEKLDGAVDRRVRRQLAESQMVVARGSRPPGAREGCGDSFGDRYGFGIISLVLAVPLSAIGAGVAGLPGLIVSWIGIVGVNAVHGSGRAPWSSSQRREKSRQTSEWD